MRPSLALPFAALAVAALLGTRPAAAQADSAATSAAVQLPQPQAQPRPHHDRNALSQEEIAERHDANAYALIRALRPGWLRGVRGASSLRLSANVVVYRDGMPVGGLDALRDQNLDSIKEIRYYDAMEATQRWGTGHDAGAIYIVTK